MEALKPAVEKPQSPAERISLISLPRRASAPSERGQPREIPLVVPIQPCSHPLKNSLNNSHFRLSRAALRAESAHQVGSPPDAKTPTP